MTLDEELAEVKAEITVRIKHVDAMRFVLTDENEGAYNDRVTYYQQKLLESREKLEENLKKYEGELERFQDKEIILLRQQQINPQVQNLTGNYVDFHTFVLIDYLYVVVCSTSTCELGSCEAVCGFDQ